MGMNYEDILHLRAISAAWRVLRLDTAPLILGFLGRVFVEDNVREIPASALTERLDGYLYALADTVGPDTYPRSAAAYLAEWSSDDIGMLRKYYPVGKAEPHYDATPALEAAVTFLHEQTRRDFISTESRLNTMFTLLEEMVHGTETDVDARLAALDARMAALAEQRAQVARGQFALMNRAALRDRATQFAETARGLLADFRQVEENLREHHRAVKVAVAGHQGTKAELLDDVLTTRGQITGSDQGRSFEAFYDAFLLSPTRQTEFADMLATLLDRVDVLDRDLAYIHNEWLPGGEAVMATLRRLSEQYRRFVDDRMASENRRVVELCRSIEHRAIRLAADGTAAPGAEVDALAPTLGLPTERPLHTEREALPLRSGGITTGDADIATDALFTRFSVDTREIAERVRTAVRRRGQVTLTDLLGEHPLEHGLEEVVAYAATSADDITTLFDEDTPQQIEVASAEGRRRIVTAPQITFVRDIRGRTRSTLAGHHDE
jgi:hypothetical protein